jgi:DNA-binding MarR family transcriptional regulator
VSPLDALDDALTRVRRALVHPRYRRELLGRLGRDVPLSTLRVMRIVERHGVAERRPTIGKVAEHLGIDPSTASRGVEDAVARGYLDRSPCADDRRRSRLSLTADGHELLDALSGARRELLGEVTDDWDEQELRALVDALERLHDGFRRLPDRR